MRYDENIKKEFENLGKNLQKMRENKKISLSEMSDMTGIRKEYLRKIEKGIAYGVRFERHLIKIADALNIDIFKLFE
ncbi:MAG: helix-turn-helix domain-containing protein [Candidatus Gastranaerophilales bacterium]|nr:helix-turn-helix domain-containing protein [Candidatus Gastranaerophilales bacterium]